MIKEAKYKMSQESLDELKAELVFLQTVREKEIAQAIKEARSYGDLSENSEYDEAKADQSRHYSRVYEVKNLIENAEIVMPTGKTDSVGIGSVVTVRDMEDSSEETYEIVGSQDADPSKGMVSDDSPFGSALLDGKKGDIVEVDAPVGTLKFKIVKIN